MRRWPLRPTSSARPSALRVAGLSRQTEIIGRCGLLSTPAGLAIAPSAPPIPAGSRQPELAGKHSAPEQFRDNTDAGSGTHVPQCSLMAALSMVFLFDLQGWLSLLAGLLLALITLFTAYDHVDIPGFGRIHLNQQVGVSFLVASLATLVVDAQLASRRRLRDQRDRARTEAATAAERRRAARDRIRAAQDRARTENAAARERDRAAEDRERASSRARIQNRCALAQLEFQLNPDNTTRQRLADLIALLRDYGVLF